MQEFQVNKNDFSKTRLRDATPRELNAGEVQLQVNHFSFTANNITYAVVGEQFKYWQFFPASDNDSCEWGIIPAWGFATISRSLCDELPVGERLFGYWPTASSLIMQPTNISASTVYDGVTHRAQLPTGYNVYHRISNNSNCDTDSGANQTDCEKMLLYPLYITAFSLHDMLQEKQWFDASQIVISSASSKTSIGLAFALSEGKKAGDTSTPSVVGLTSARNLATVRSLGLYDHVVTYDNLTEIDASQPTLITDMSANGDMLSRLHKHLAERMRFCFNVGFTDWQNTAPGPDFIVDRSKVFFAPDQIQKRIAEWGQDGFDKKSADFINRGGEQTRQWLQMRTIDGLSGLSSIYSDVCQGKVNPKQGLIIKL